MSNNVHPYQDIWRAWCLTLDRAMTKGSATVASLFTSWGEWEKVKDDMDTMLEDEAYYQQQYEDMEEEKNEMEERATKAEEKKEEILEEVECISTWLGTIQEGVEDEGVRNQIQSVIDNLDNVVKYEGVEKKPKVKQKRRKV